MKYLIILLFCPMMLFGQQVFQREKRDYTWRVGLAGGGEPVPDSKILFTEDTVTLSYILTTVYYQENNATMCDTAGRLIFQTNGLWVADSLENMMPNGDTISSNYYNEDEYFSEDYLIQGTLALPAPGHSNLYYLFHGQSWWFPSLPNTLVHETAKIVFYSIIDMAQNGGLGDVVVRRQVMIDDTLTGFHSRLKACRHANGRDWWLPVSVFPNRYNTYLLDPTGVHLVNEQVFDYHELRGNGQAAFSTDGSKYARFVNNSDYLQLMRIRLFNFDRCTGQLTDDKLLPLPPVDSLEYDYLGLSFSPNGRFLYINDVCRLYQYDLWEAAPEPVFIDFWCNGNGSGYWTSYLGPNDKIYIAPFSYDTIPVILYPDLKGDSCSVCYDCLVIPNIVQTTFSNFAEYRTGPLDGSACDTLGIDMPLVVGVAPSAFKQKEVHVHPNPATDVLQVVISDEVVGALQFELYDGTSRQVLRQVVARGYNAVDIAALPQGVYFWEAKDGQGRSVKSGKVVKL